MIKTIKTITTKYFKKDKLYFIVYNKSIKYDYMKNRH